MRLPLAYYGDPVLRKKGARVEKITPEIEKLVEDMIETMHAANGIGIAAPQVHQSLLIFITCVPLQVSEKEWTPGTLRVFINPKILSYSDEQWTWTEGCLSIPGIYEDVSRPLTIEVEAMDLEGKTFNLTLEGPEAHAFMHENDHINGVLFIDRLHPKIRKEIEPALREIKKKYQGKK